jgi:hypothetical protein
MRKHKLCRPIFIGISLIALLYSPIANAKREIAGEGASYLHYENMTENQLITVYKDAYTKSGFNFLKQVQRLSASTQPTFITNLEFELPIPNRADKAYGSLVFSVSCSQWKDGSHPSCAISFDTFYSYEKNYTNEEEINARANIRAAHLKACDVIKEKLGKSFP